jgi:putative heme-binding domain-containing protein
LQVEDPRGLKLAWDSAKSADLTARLDDPRPAVRHRAIQALANRGAEAIAPLERSLRQSSSPLARVNAVWALTRMEGDAARAAVRLALEDRDAGVQQAALHSVGMRRDRQALPRVLGFLQAPNRFHRRKAAEALGRIGDRSAVPSLLAAAGEFRAGFPEEAAVVRIQEHAWIYALIELADATATRQGLASASSFTHRAALIALDQMEGGGVKVEEVAPLLSANDPVLRGTASWIAGHHSEWGQALAGYFRGRVAERALPLEAREELERQLSQFGKDAAIQGLLAEQLRRQDLPVESSRLLLRAMAASGVREVPPAWLTALAGKVTARETEVARAAVATVRALPMPKTNVAEINAALWRTAREAARPSALRVEALAAMPGGAGELEAGVFALLLQRLDPELPAAERGAAAGVLAQARLSTEQQTALARTLKEVGPMELNRLLEAFQGATSEAVGQAMVASLLESKALASVRVDLLRQRLAQFPATVQEAGRQVLIRLDVDPEEQAARLEALLTAVQGLKGEIRRGQLIFNSPKTACVTCHAMGYVGGKVGPDLTSIGQIRTERDLLEAVAFPNASFVRSFEPVLVSTKDDEEYGGVVANELEDELVLVTGADTQVRLARSDIAGIRPGTVSVMPSGLDEQLTQQELADLLAFLKNTKWGPQ